MVSFLKGVCSTNLKVFEEKRNRNEKQKEKDLIYHQIFQQRYLIGSVNAL